MTLDHGWLDLTREDALDPDLAICDPHHHLWDKREVPFYRSPRYLLDDLLADTEAGHRIVSTVFIECRAMYRTSGPEAMRPLGETEFVNGVAAMSVSGLYGPTRVAAGIIGHVNLLLGDAARPLLEAHIAAGGGRFRGIRHSASWHESAAVRNAACDPPPSLYAQPAFRTGFAHLAPLGLGFEAWLYHPQIRELTELARAFPETTIVLDHFGGPLGIGPYAGKRAEVLAQWKDDIAELARCPNVHAKLGGLQMDVNGFDWHERERPPGSEELAAATAPYHEHCIEHFGVRRCMFESNFPVDNLSCSYAVLWNAFKRIAHGASASEKASLFHDTATRVYRL